MSKRYLIDSLRSLNEFFMDGVEAGTLAQIYGPFQAGKSLLILQMLYEWVSKGLGNALVLDTELSILNNFSRRWHDRFIKRFGREVSLNKVSSRKYVVKGGKRRYLTDVTNVVLEVLSDLDIEVDRPVIRRLLEQLIPEDELYPEKEADGLGHIFVCEIKDLSHLYRLMGLEANVTEEKDKIDIMVRHKTDLYASSLARFIEKYHIKFVSLDSLGGLIKTLTSMNRVQNFPVRASALNILLHNISRLANELELVVFVSNHESRSPINNFYSFYGGSSVGYGFKYTLYLKRVKEYKRELIGYRAPHLPENAFNVLLKITEGGFYEVDKDADKDS